MRRELLRQLHSRVLLCCAVVKFWVLMERKLRISKQKHFKAALEILPCCQTCKVQLRVGLDAKMNTEGKQHVISSACLITS